MILRTIEQLDGVRFDRAGLVPVVAQHAHTGSVLMLAYANRAALELTLSTGLMHFYSRSRQSLWQKGESSGHRQQVIDLSLDCDGDALLARVLPAGPACHTGASNCFGVEPLLIELAQVIEERRATRPAGSYTVRLLDDANLRLKKLGEEALELALACQSGDRAGVAEESADLFYHLLVAAGAAGVSLADVLAVLAGRSALRVAAPHEQPENKQ